MEQVDAAISGWTYRMSKIKVQTIKVNKFDTEETGKIYNRKVKIGEVEIPSIMENG